MQRILKVRDTQKRLKETALQKAGNHCAALKHSATRIRHLHAETLSHGIAEQADMLAAKMELADRLVDAQHKMDVSIETARQEFADAERQNIAAQSTYEGTDKLLKSKLKKARKAEIFHADINHNMLYNIDNKRKKERRNDW